MLKLLDAVVPDRQLDVVGGGPELRLQQLVRVGLLNRLGLVARGLVVNRIDDIGARQSKSGFGQLSCGRRRLARRRLLRVARRAELDGVFALARPL